MKLIIDISEEVYKDIQDGFYNENLRKMAIAIGNGTPLPKGHGRLIDADSLLEKQYRIDDSATLSTRDVVNVEDVEDTSTIIEADKTGHWEYVQYDYNPRLGNWHCSECRCVIVACVDKNDKGGIPLYKYCPNCGAKMEEGDA